MSKEFSISLATSNLIDKYKSIDTELNKELKKEFLPVIKKCVEENDIEGLDELRKHIPESHSFFIRVCQGIVEIQAKNKKHGI